MATTQSVPPIARGYARALRVRVTGDVPAFPVGATWRADVRDYAGAPALAGTLVSGDGIERIDDETLELRIPATFTARLTNSSAVLDLVRTDVAPDDWIGVQVQLPVVTPVTVPVAGA